MERILEIFLNIWYHFIGYASCHQMPERTLSFGGKMLFVCCRCSAIYAGYVISYIFIYFTGRKRARKFPSRGVFIFGLILSSLMFLDVFSVLFKLREGSNETRILTGLLAGSALPFVIFPLLNRLIPGDGIEKRSVKDVYSYLFVIFLSLVTFFLIHVHSLYFLFWIFFILIATGLVLIYVNLNAVFILLFFRLTGFCRDLSMGHINFLSLVISFVEIFVVYALYKFLGVK